MLAIRSCLCVCLLVAFGILTPAVASAAGPLPARIAVSEVQTPVTPLPAWDGASPQRIVLIEDRLYQEDAGFYYRVADESISVRLGPGMGSWDELLQQAAPDVRAALQALTPLRTNRLAIVDLELPDRDPAYWAELVFQTGLVHFAELDTFGEWVATPNDPLYSAQWALNNSGQSGGTPGADIDAEDAWNVTSGNPAIVVAILDSGTQVTHPDLAANIWQNPGEIPNNGADDDGNGFVDDVNGWDFENNNSNVGGFNWHGTHVAGVIIADTDNGTGIAGLAGGLGTSGARGMVVQVGDSGPVGSIIDDAILYAADNGAKVITLSLSVGSTSSINNALGYALGTKDVFIDCAAGNNGSSVAYPANRPEVMAVASTNRWDQRSNFSNPGPQVEVAAPGEDIRSTQTGSSYGTSSGTSFAAPYVGALAALIRGLNPTLSAPEVRQLIIDTADDVESPGFDNLTGHGRINAAQAVNSVGSSNGTVALDSAVYDCTGVFQVTVEDFDLVGDGTLVVTAQSDSEPDAEDVYLSEQAPGVYEGTFPIGAGDPVSDGMLQVSHEDTLTVKYVDVGTGTGQLFVTKLAQASIDCAGPAIFDLQAVDIDDTSARIVWTTDEMATSAVHFDENLPLEDQASSPGFTLAHSVTLTDLKPCTNYRYRVESTDGLGHPAIDDNNGLLHAIQTRGFEPGVGLTDCPRGQARMDAASYGCAETVEVSVTDLDLDTDPGAVETVEVLLTSTSETGGEWISLTESGTSSTLFEGSITLDAATVSDDGLLGVASGDLITVSYFDEDDGTGRARVATHTSLADCTAPTIEELRITAISATRAMIEWTSNEPSTSRVEFGPTAALGSVVEDLELTTEHSLAISAFDACQRVYFTVSSVDERGSSGFAGVGGQPLQFNLKRIGGLVFHDNFETDEGWNLEGEWEREVPLGFGSGSRDPAEAYSGSRILGTDLSGGGAHPGDYEPLVTDEARSPSFDGGGGGHLELILRRKLGVNAADTAKITADFFFPNQLIWSSEGAVDDADWVEIRHVLGSVGGLNGIRLRFSIESAASSHAYGWNIDEVIVKEVSQPDYLLCADCSGAPSFGGLLSVHDPEPCDASGLELNWAAAPAWGTGGTGTYEVHRGTTAGFVPDETNRVASGLTVTSWTDLAAPVDSPTWYVVRARNDEDCGGGVGLADDNLIRGTATETIFQSPPSSVGSSVRVTEVGKAHVRLSWDPIPGAAGYLVRRSLAPDFAAPVELGSTAEIFFEHVEAAADESTYFYRVFAVNACGQEGP